MKMSNPLFRQLGNLGNNNLMQQFAQFKNSFKGNPQQVVQNMLNSGQISQEQVNKAMQMAKQLGMMK